MSLHSVCFGEVLWDLLPNGKQAGGAPMNVAFRLNEFHHKVQLLTAIGKDDLGKELLEMLKAIQLSNDVHISDHLPTGTVAVELNDAGNACYTIVEEVAWDEIHHFDICPEPFQLIFGSLSLRSNINQASISTLIERASEVVFDINLRKPFYSFELIDAYIQVSDVIKLNEDELDWLCAQLQIQPVHSITCFLELSKHYPKKTWCVTLGEKGALLFEKDELFQSGGFPVQVVDTIGAGDAFLAALLHKRNLKAHPLECLAFACKVGSTVAGQRGATQALPKELLSE